MRTIAALAALAAVWTATQAAALAPQADRETAHFGRCDGRSRASCVIDGDTIRYRGRTIRLADINAPELSRPGCAAEARLGARAARRLTALLNAGAFSLEPVDRNRDTYGRLLRQVTRGGRSLGARLEAEGLAERWRGYRGNWCRTARSGPPAADRALPFAPRSPI